MKNLLIDCNNICHIAKHTVGELSYDEIPTGVIYGFLLKLITIAEDLGPARFFFFWDSRKSYRRDFWSGYKQKRREELTREDIKFFEQFDNMRENVLPALGFRNIYQQEGYESDDLMHFFVRWVAPSLKNIMVTTDKDMYQSLLLCNTYNPITKEMMSSQKFHEKYGFSADRWVELKAIGGCSSDGIPGIEGVSDPAHSEKSKAFALLSGELNKGKIYKRWRSGKGIKIVRRNTKLIKLPFDGPEPIEMSVQQDRVTKRKLIKVFDHYGIKSFLGQKQLKRIFNVLSGREVD